MHPNPAFRKMSRAENLEFARCRAFGTLAINGDGGPLLAHVPFLLDTAGDMTELHLTRTNPIVAAVDGAVPAVISVHGPDGYVSPDWYGIADQVPTWNYVAVHLRGSIERLPQDALPDLLERQSALFEGRLAPKPAWTLDKLPAAKKAGLMRAIVPFRLKITDVDGTWKLSQNKPAQAVMDSASQLPGGFGHELMDLAELMKGLDDPL